MKVSAALRAAPRGQNRLGRVAVCFSRHTRVLDDMVSCEFINNSRLSAPASRAISLAHSAALNVTRYFLPRCLARAVSALRVSTLWWAQAAKSEVRA